MSEYERRNSHAVSETPLRVIRACVPASSLHAIPGIVRSLACLLVRGAGNDVPDGESVSRRKRKALDGGNVVTKSLTRS